MKRGTSGNSNPMGRRNIYAVGTQGEYSGGGAWLAFFRKQAKAEIMAREGPASGPLKRNVWRINAAQAKDMPKKAEIATA